MKLNERLHMFRTEAGLSLAQVSDRTGIGESSLSEYENEKREPNLSQLRKLSEVYQTTLSSLLDETADSTRPTVLWRDRPEGNAQELEAQFLRLCSQYYNLEVWCGETVPCRLPQPQGTEDSFSWSQAERLAAEVRNQLQLGDRPALCLLKVLEEVCGLKVFHLEFTPSGTAASSRSDSFGAAILLNRNNIRWRRNFDLAHELFHLLTWHIFHPTDSVSVLAGDKEEKLADCFASELLMPRGPFMLAVDQRVKDGVISHADLFDIAREFDVSASALMWRFHKLYNRTSEQKDITRRDIDMINAVAAFCQRNDSKPDQWPERYSALALDALRKGEASVGRIAKYLEINRNDLMHLLEQEVDGDEVRLDPA